MQSSHDRQRRANFAYAAVAGFTLLLAFLLRYPSLYEPRWYTDEGIFAAVAQNIRHGSTLYSQAWDNKPPLIFFTYAAIQSAFGNSILALHLVTMAVAMATQVTVIAIAWRLYGARGGAVAGVVFAFALSTPVIEGNLAMTETFMILPTSLAVLVFVLAQQRDEARRIVPYLLVGVLLGIAAGYKQVAIFDGAAIGLMIWCTHARQYRALAALAGGFVIPQIVFVALFLADGAFSSYWYAVVGSLGLYSDLGPDEGPFIRFAGLLPALLATAWLVRRRQRGAPITMQHLPVLWLGFAIAGATSSSFPFPHYLQQAVPALALCVAAAPIWADEDDAGKLALGVGALLVVAVVFGQFAFAFEDRRQLDPIDYYRTFASHRYGTMSDLDYEYYFDGNVITVRDVVASIDADGGSHASLYTWSELPWLYAAGSFTNPTRYYTSFLGEVIPGAKAEILRDLDARPPAYILVSDDTFAPFGELERLVDQHYEIVTQHNDWRLYRRLADKTADAGS